MAIADAVTVGYRHRRRPLGSLGEQRLQLRLQRLRIETPWGERPDASVGEMLRGAFERLQECDCHALPVVAHGRLVGLVTDRDLVVRGVAQELDLKQCKLSDIMSGHVRTVREDDDIQDVLTEMSSAQMRRMPVVDPQDRLVGMVSLGDIAASMGLAQYDIKKVLAYSTVSQLGYMMLALGVGGWLAGLFHLVTHAFFKSLLFLGAGAVPVNPVAAQPKAGGHAKGRGKGGGRHAAAAGIPDPNNDIFVARIAADGRILLHQRHSHLSQCWHNSSLIHNSAVRLVYNTAVLIRLALLNRLYHARHDVDVVHKVECQLIPVLNRMTTRGIRVDEERLCDRVEANPQFIGRLTIVD